MDLKKWQQIQSKCEYNKEDNKTIFGRCSKTNSKCSFSNCPLKAPPFVSCGTSNQPYDTHPNKGGNALTVQETKALSLRNKETLSYAKIGARMDISKKRAYELVQNALKKVGGNDSKKIKKFGGNDKLGGVTVRKKKGVTLKQHKINLHNDSIALECVADIDKAEGDLKPLKYISYRFIKTDKHVIKIFPNKLVVQFRQDIEALTIQEAYEKATKRINDYISNFYMPYVHINKKEAKQLSRHYAILGTEVAKKYIKEGKKLFIYDTYDGKERVRIDYSDKDKKGGLPHFEFTHAEKGQEDADANKRFIESIINYPHYLPHETKGILDTILTTQKEYAYHIRKHLEVQDETLKTLKAIQASLK